MSEWQGDWDATSRVAWARAFGYAVSDLFGPDNQKYPEGEHSILLDGRAASFAFLKAPDADLLVAQEPQAWAWSSNVRHIVAVHERTSTLFLRRWDAVQSRRFPLPKSRNDALEIVRTVEASAVGLPGDVISHVLTAFRSAREIVPAENPLVALNLFDTLLLGAALVTEKKIKAADLKKRATIGGIVDMIAAHVNLGAYGIDADFDESVRARSPFATLDRFLAPEPRFNYQLDTSLLLRHASGEVYQEAHLVLETNPQLRMAGFAPQKPSGAMRLGIRFTPPTLARALTEQALALVKKGSSLVVLDPACGSGVFLIEAVRELIRQGYQGRLELRGIDKSPLSSAMAKFCVELAAHEARAAGIDATATIYTANSMEHDWSDADVVLMNPPFIRWNDLDDHAKEQVRGEVAKGRADLAMAFVSKAVRGLKAGGTVAAVVPAPLLDSAHGAEWRETLAANANVNLIGRFEGFSYFRASFVEPAFLVFSKGIGSSDGVKVLIAAPGAEERSLRALREPEIPPDDPKKWSVITVHPSVITGHKWMPRWPKSGELEQQLRQQDMPRVADLFEVRQGVLTGMNDVFVLRKKQFLALPEAERCFFRPAAGSPTISEGRLTDGEYVFYPYRGDEAVFDSSKEVIAAVPTFYLKYMEPKLGALSQRQGISPDRWWELTRGKLTQQGMPKLVTSYFGRQGGFAFDEGGTYVVVQGYSWNWRGASTSELFDGDDVEVEIQMERDLAFAYLAVLNSSVFEAVLDVFCPRVAGRQFNLSKRFVARAFLPNLASPDVPPEVFDSLAALGRQIHNGELAPPENHATSVAAAYHIDPKTIPEILPNR